MLAPALSRGQPSLCLHLQGRPEVPRNLCGHPYSLQNPVPLSDSGERRRSEASLSTRHTVHEPAEPRARACRHAVRAFARRAKDRLDAPEPGWREGLHRCLPQQPSHRERSSGAAFGSSTRETASETPRHAAELWGYRPSASSSSVVAGPRLSAPTPCDAALASRLLASCGGFLLRGPTSIPRLGTGARRRDTAGPPVRGRRAPPGPP